MSRDLFGLGWWLARALWWRRCRLGTRMTDPACPVMPVRAVVPGRMMVLWSAAAGRGRPGGRISPVRPDGPGTGGGVFLFY